MSLLPEQIGQLARLAHIHLDEGERETIGHRLDPLLALMATLQDAVSETLEPMLQPQLPAPRLRDDVVTEEDARAACQALAPHTENGLYLVPRVIE